MNEQGLQQLDEVLEKPVIINDDESYDLSFEKIQYKPDIVFYKFDKVVITIDTTGIHYKDAPEILLSTFTDDFAKGSIYKPETRIEGVDMNYIAACIRKVSDVSGIHEAWLYPFGDDNPKDVKKREDARLRLFRRYVEMTPAPGGIGYIITG